MYLSNYFYFLLSYICKNECTVHRIHKNKLYVDNPKFSLIGYTIKESWSKTIQFSDNNIGDYFMTLEWNYFLNWHGK